MKITVTKEDIENGRKRDPNNCAVALALRRAGITHFGVTGMLVCIAPGPTSVMLPGPVQEWIMDFDRGTAVGPIDFDLALPGREREPEMAPCRPSAQALAVGPQNWKPELEHAPRTCRSRNRLPLSALVRQVASAVPILFSEAGDRASVRKSSNVAIRRTAKKVLITD